ncbi:CD2 antigen cytoplasmic tail-binding protein 2 homolog isoform X2 [Toxorhynchites rutilus septentrionalis]|uniref:CD2 antigen cytoplasmic tail-binding protein 2 homolog isoform X2 n=1 Tax=Toxorhynchites rutilus septentrionalis TaxID=329112 RepID=UPI0024789194|nr:CD2 antigen cytoplasmic tail-binding protein 2 homolog isoform X2 [Toxorhynchites rutilus septentrionalis]
MRTTAAKTKLSEYNVLNDNEIEGEEEGIARVDGEMKFTPFNMKEEMEEGHFDADGHYLWKKGAEIRDNWLDNIDWVKIKNDPDYKDKKGEGEVRGLGESDSEDEEDEKSKRVDSCTIYRNILEMMEPKETIKKALQRIGKKNAKLTTAQRWKMKKAGTLDDSSEKVTRLTELANEILTREGNMDIYEETYEMVQKKITEGSAATKDELDMYADDFDHKEKGKLKEVRFDEASDAKPSTSRVREENDDSSVLMWEYKEQQDGTEIHGPFTTEQMHKYAEEGRFKNGAFVRKVGNTDTRFYSAARIDFELYL